MAPRCCRVGRVLTVYRSVTRQETRILRWANIKEFVDRFSQRIVGELTDAFRRRLYPDLGKVLGVSDRQIVVRHELHAATTSAGSL